MILAIIPFLLEKLQIAGLIHPALLFALWTMMECILENNDKKTTCYCGSQKFYEECCFPFISGSLIPKNPEQLMRSRYSAFCIKNIEYLIS
ncbi:MAG: hypothetical protein K8S18_11970, partial [Desulfobacula sp.]|nr:hypothetical protein [Desulfobacula sp.]